ncbi:unnamed protein product [Ceutorhynchus assimilis]|uniref:LRRCT domain-containing protein n=1 Tax=Ceutorhynchus assimilis TaxID=467358 RepID=A0A9N9MZL3_9CUCU|nr:unnamed protein product [Ceutorhynchus assimilis]
MVAKRFLSVILVVLVGHGMAQKRCPVPKAILPCRCLIRAEEFQIWCTHSDLPSVLEGLKTIATLIKTPIDEVILENNYLPSLPGRTFFPLKILRLMLRHNGLERVSNDWLSGLETDLMELFIVEPKLRTIPEDSLRQQIALQAITVESELMKRLPLFSGLPKLRYLQIESNSLLELSPRNFKDNPSLEKIHIGRCPLLTRLEANLFRDLPSLSLLNVSDCGVTWMHHRAITRLPVLQELILMGNRISDAGMVGRASRELPQLAILRLDSNYIDRIGEAAFVDLPALKSLHLSNNRITELHHGAFHRVPRLKSLNLNDNFLRRVHPESFLQESGSGLEELWLVRNEIGHVADLRAILDALPRLVFLDMSHNQLEAIPFGSLRGHPTLEHFNLDHNLIHLIDREAFVAMPALRELQLKNNSLSNNLQPPLWNLPELKGLDLSQNYFRRLEPNFLQDLPSLRKIDLSGNQLTFIDPASFILTPSLENVNISGNNLATLHPATFRHLLALYELDISRNHLLEFAPGLPRGLEYLHLSDNDITVLPMAPTPDLDMPALRLLDLSRNKIEALPKEAFATLPQLRRLFISDNFLKKIDDANFKGLSRLETLDFSNNAITHLGSNAFRHQSELRDLNLANNRIDLLMPDCFQNCPHLKRLNLTLNNIPELLPGTLDKNKDLQMIDLSYNKLAGLSGTFKGLKNLRVLDLTHNNLDSIDPEILGSLTSLRQLKLSNNHLKILRENGFNKLQHLATLDLAENDLEVIEANAIKTMPVLKTINLSRNKLKEIPNMVFVNLPSLQAVELQENQLKSVSSNAFAAVPHLLMLNLSRNHLNSLDEAGLKGAKSLELLDVSRNSIKTVAGAGLDKMEWLVELRMDDNQICGVQGSPFNNMPRLRVLSLKNNKMMSFPERAIERIRNNIAILDIEGNPLACSCNMLWLQVWLQESATIGPRCADGYLLRDLELLRRDCPEEERNVELVAPGCESELLSAPGVYGTSQVLSQWMNLKSINGSENRNSLAPAPEDSEYFYDEYVDYPFNETSTLKVPITTGDTLYALPNIKNKPLEKVTNSPSSSGFTFFGVPLSNLGALLGNAVNARKEDKVDAASSQQMADRVAIVNIPKPLLPDLPKIETGGFVPLLPGVSGGFKPIPNPTLTHQNLQFLQKKNDSFVVESNNIPSVSSTSEKPTTAPPLKTSTIKNNITTTQKPTTQTAVLPTTSATTTLPTKTTTVVLPIETSTILKLDSSPTLLAPQQKKMATITKVALPNLQSTSAPFEALLPQAHNREPKTLLQPDWYFAMYNGTSGVDRQKTLMWGVVFSVLVNRQLLL